MPAGCLNSRKVIIQREVTCQSLLDIHSRLPSLPGKPWCQALLWTENTCCAWKKWYAPNRTEHCYSLTGWLWHCCPAYGPLSNLGRIRAGWTADLGSSGCCPHIPCGTCLAERRLWVGWALADCSSPTTTEKWKQRCWEHSAGCHLKYENVGVASLNVFLGPSHAWHSQHFKDNILLARTSMNSKGTATLAKRGLQWIEVRGNFS